MVVHLFAFVCVLPHLGFAYVSVSEKFLFLNHLRKVQLYTFYEKKATDAYLEFLRYLLLSKSVNNKCRQFLLLNLV
jgi:hypothetical protein